MSPSTARCSGIRYPGSFFHSHSIIFDPSLAPPSPLSFAAADACRLDNSSRSSSRVLLLPPPPHRPQPSKAVERPPTDRPNAFRPTAPVDLSPLSLSLSHRPSRESCTPPPPNIMASGAPSIRPVERREGERGDLLLNVTSSSFPSSLPLSLFLGANPHSPLSSRKGKQMEGEGRKEERKGACTREKSCCGRRGERERESGSRRPKESAPGDGRTPRKRERESAHAPFSSSSAVVRPIWLLRTKKPAPSLPTSLPPSAAHCPPH